MSQNVATSFQPTFQNNLELLLNQTKSALWDAIDSFDATGEKVAVKDLIGNSAVSLQTERHGDIKLSDTSHDRVWLPKPLKAVWAEMIDDEDQLATAIDLTSGYMQSAMAAINRYYDDQDLAGIYAAIISGKDGTTSTAFPSGNYIPVTTGGASGAQRMNVAKLRAANKFLAQNYNDPMEKKYMILTAEQNDDLLSEVPATSSDFTASFGGKVDENGNVTQLLGWNFIHLELANSSLNSSSLTVDGSGYRLNPFWVRSGLRRGVWMKLKTSIDRVPMKALAKLLQAHAMTATTRTQAGKVGIIRNSEA